MNMKREIKLRAKGVGNGKWCYGVIHNEGINLFPVSVDTNTIGQFTGLVDCDGVEIYEGDVVRSNEYKDIKHIVVYDEKCGSFMAVLINGNMNTSLESKCHINQEWIDNFPKKIIGNIHDKKYF